jgi:hypothetical protein
MRRLLVLFLLVVVLIPSPAGAQQNEFSAGQLVLVTANGATLREAPGDTAASVATVTTGDELQVLTDDPTEVDATFWWNVRSLERGIDGWLPDSALAPKFLAPTPDPGQRSAGPCEGLDGYAADFVLLFDTTALSHPAAMEILNAIPTSNTDYVGFIETLSPEELLVLRDFYLALAEEMDRMDPPSFAKEWHQLQRDSLELTGDIFGDAASMGILAASTIHSQRTLELIDAVQVFFETPNRCPSFLTWAHAQTLLTSL